MRKLVGEIEVPAFLDRGEVRDRLLSSETASAANLSGYWQTLFLLRWTHLFRVRFT